MGNKPHIGIVVVGRNEGDRLTLSLQSACQDEYAKTYVDSGSSDGSVALAKGYPIDVLELSDDKPFTAARARNQGYRHPISQYPDLECIQFLDADCVLDSGWLESAYAALNADESIGAVSGQRSERFPDATIFHRLVDIEWRLMSEDPEFFGGDVLVRRRVLEDTDGYAETLIAGEDPELAHRMKVRGWRIQVLDIPMTRHDSGALGLRSWFIRMFRAGYAYAEVNALSGRYGQKLWSKQIYSNWFWGGVLPGLVVATSTMLSSFALAMLALYPLMIVRIYARFSDKLGKSNAALYAVSCITAKIPLSLGQFRYYWLSWFDRKSALIEYK